ncbi:hypothetical protein BJ878DRAFT_499960 [Calycina marina]|uniref:Synaptobrevin n=1 Tax=Calycina marina TaxID=1763456 RepID=A0A9P7Z5K4_9HELO|nr:hypothetical protein BJ878DRAFT_499960 [Calycina marina]
MTRTASTASSSATGTATNLERLLQRLQFLLVSPDVQTEELLRTSKNERQKVAENIAYSCELLLELEQDASAIRILSRKQDAQSMLVKQRQEFAMLSERLQELNELGEHGLDMDGDSDGEDLLGEDTPDESMETDEGRTPPGTASMSECERRSIGMFEPAEDDTASIPPAPEPEPSTKIESSTLRHRRDALFNTPVQTTALESRTQEQLMTHNRSEQEEITTSMLSMATELKQRSRAFAAALAGEKEVLERAAKGLESNELGMETAQRKMGFLSTYTEGRGWLVRLMIYPMIVGLWLLALMIVFMFPKLRF